VFLTSSSNGDYTLEYSSQIPLFSDDGWRNAKQNATVGVALRGSLTTFFPHKEPELFIFLLQVAY